MTRSAVIRFVAFLGVLAVLLAYVAYHKVPEATGPAQHHNHVMKNTQTASTEAVANYIANLKQNRDSLMTKEIATLKAVAANQTVSQAARKQAAATLVNDTQDLAQDLRIEGILTNQGITEAVATVGNGSAQIVVGQAQLTQTEVGRIANVVIEVTGLAPQDIVIIPRTASS